MIICPICDEQYEPTEQDLPEGFCEHCAQAVDNGHLADMLRELFDATCVEITYSK